MSSDVPCPNPELLAAFGQGKLAGEAFEAVGRHLAGCSACGSLLSRLDEAGDGLFANLRRFSEQPTSAMESALRGLEARARAIPLEGAAPIGGTPGGEGEAPAGGGHLNALVRLGPYDLLEEVGRGGMGVVYLAMHTHLGKRVALKVISPAHASDPAILARFRREMRSIGALSHPGVVGATDAGEADGLHYLVTEYVDGLDLAALLQRCGPLPVADACEVARQAALGLQYIHDRGRVHRDLKPSNLMLTADGTVKILDLGLALLLAEGAGSEELTGTNQAMGTPDYMAPEQWANSHAVDVRADLYSLGCTLFKLLTGEAPFGGPGHRPARDKRAAHAGSPVPPVRARRPDVPAELDGVLGRLLAKGPESRYSTPKELVGALEGFSAGSDLPALLGRARAGSQPGPSSPTPMLPSRVATETYPSLSRTTGDAEPEPQAGRPFAPLRTRVLVGLLCLAVAAGGLAVGLSHLPRPPAGGPGEGDPPGRSPLELAPRVWHPLLDKKPSEVYWHNPAGNASWDFKKERQEVWIDSMEPALLGLGTTDRTGYQVRVRIRQTNWTGGAGVFFGHRKVGDGPVRHEEFQYLRLVAWERRPDGAFGLERAVGTVKADARGVPGTGTRGVAAAKLARPLGREDQVLELMVKRGRLAEVRWNGEPLPGLTAPAVNAEFAEGNYRGGFGLYNAHSATVFRGADFMGYERE